MKSFVFIALLVSVSKAQSRYFTSIEQFHKSLQPVQGLYVKPSADGSTGDLYVAATEDDGVQTPWISDASVKLLPHLHQDKDFKTGEGKQNSVDTQIKKEDSSTPMTLEEEVNRRFVQMPQFFYSQRQYEAAAPTLATAASEIVPNAVSAVPTTALAVSKDVAAVPTPNSSPVTYNAPVEVKPWDIEANVQSRGSPLFVILDPSYYAQFMAMAEQEAPSGQQVKLIKL